MTEETDALFEAMFAMEDAREILRETAPKHKLTDEQKRRLSEALKKAEASLNRLRRLA